jgi:phosphotransferase system  glucose/maltose/N-acetylglucosamine-specific IIC component
VEDGCGDPPPPPPPDKPNYVPYYIGVLILVIVVVVFVLYTKKHDKELADLKRKYEVAEIKSKV